MVSDEIFRSDTPTRVFFILQRAVTEVLKEVAGSAGFPLPI
jgi:hypothetical protein